MPAAPPENPAVTQNTIALNFETSVSILPQGDPRVRKVVFAIAREWTPSLRR
jgi:hypothetical protein